MKLKTKITIAAVGMMLLASQAFSIWNLAKTQEQILDNILQDESVRLSDNTSRFNRGLNQNHYQSALGEQYAGLSIFRSVFGKTDYNDETILYYNGQELRNSTPYEFDITEAALQGRAYSSYEISYGEQISAFLEEINGRRLLILLTGSSDRPSKPIPFSKYGTFQILHYRDITPIYESKRALLFQSIAVALLLSILLSLALVFTLRKILSPVYRLRDAANAIAKGGYKKRVENPGTDEIGEVSRCFNKMADRVEEQICTLADMNEKQRQLMGSLAHELKTPMTGIQGYAELLQRVKLPPEKQDHALHYIEAECKRLSRLSNKMLQLTKLSGENKIEKKPRSMSVLFSKAEEITRYRLKENGLHLKIKLEHDMEIECDEDLFLSLITNLIDNACKASPAKSCICLSGTESGIFVEDEGPGIPEDEITRITEPFYMVDKSRSRKEGGAGLGLALCLQIARLHGGRLEIKNRPEGGAYVGVRFEKTLYK